MQFTTLDLLIIAVFFIITLGIGVWSARRAGKSSQEFFLSGRNMPWWLLGVSMVATTFSADTPNLVTDIVRTDGVAGNWAWWAFLITGMVTVFIYARLWRRAGLTTDLGFYELRYSGRPAMWLRGFRAIYLGVFFNAVIMATVLLAGSKISSVMLGLTEMQTILLISLVTVTYSGLGGLRGIILTDFFQFVLSMIGMILAAWLIIDMPEIGGLDGLMAHTAVRDALPVLPDFSDPDVAIPLFLIPIAVQWWAVWYPGAEPGGGGYVVQRMLSTKQEDDAVKATLLFNLAHYALRPWPWILIALASLVIYPDLASIQAAYPQVDASLLGHDLAFPAMLTHLPAGLIGLLVAALTAALMSTISTHLNWGASYVVYDVYQRFIKPEASERQLVLLGRLITVGLMALAGIISIYLHAAKEAFDLLLQIGAGTGLLFLLRWFWWRINAYSEMAAMVISFIVAFVLNDDRFDHMPSYEKLVIGVAITTVCWLVVTWLTRPTDREVLRTFYQTIRPYKAGWRPVADELTLPNKSGEDSLGVAMTYVFLGCVGIYAALFGLGYALYGDFGLAGGAGLLLIIALTAAIYLHRRGRHEG